MKKTIFVMFSVLAIALGMIGPAAAQPGKLNIKGEVTAISGDAITVKSNQGESYLVSIPEGMVLSAIEVGDTVLIKATAGENGAWIARSIKQVGFGGADDEDEIEVEDDDLEGFRDHSAFCAEGKHEGSHPLASAMAERFGVDEDMVMDYFCEGYSIGAIMLAVKTSQLEGVGDDIIDTLLTRRAGGEGWGQIWQDLGLIGSEREGHSPPGLLNRPDHAGPKK